ncbi:MAG: glycosyltransferase [Phycisphaeraceae bacterium]|nr:glycosyltransferase [Phycisphaeraceae bacterium]
MPTLNSEAFLTPRLESIRRQTLKDWELVVVDSQSDDATLSMIDAFAGQGGVVRVYQGPRDGIYTNINRSIEYAQGDYIYIATSDDTMADDCLEKMVQALDQHPSCGMAHCSLRMLDSVGERFEHDWWESRSTFARSAGEMRHKTHVRRAPYDGLLHMLGETVYISLTQLLVRRTVFDCIGMFRSDWGSISDYYWDMRAALTADTVHVGDTWASWRVHETQATASAAIGQQSHTEKIDDMIKCALRDSEGDLPAEVRAKVDAWLKDAEELRRFLTEVHHAPGRAARWAYLGKQMLRGSGPAKDYVFGKVLRDQPMAERSPKLVEGWLQSVGLDPFDRVVASS